MCPIISAEGRVFPVDMRFSRRGEQRDQIDLVTATVPEALRATTGHVLVFLPGVGEIMRCERELAAAADRQGHAVLTLFGDMPPEQQDRVLTDVGRRKIILATNVAETSLTIPGITAVIDSGLARQLRVSPATGRGGPAVPVPASVGGSGTRPRTTTVRGPTPPRHFAATSQPRFSTCSLSVNTETFPGSTSPLPTVSKTPAASCTSSVRSNQAPRPEAIA